MKRFFDTDLWQKPWFMDLAPSDKIAWFYLIGACDNVGVWTPNFRLANFQIGTEIDWEDFINRCNGNIVITDKGKWWLVDFCRFQHPDLDEGSSSNAVKSYVTLLKKHGLFEQYTNGTCSVREHSKEQEQERDRERVKEKEGENLKVADTTRELIDLLNERAGTAFRDGEGHRAKVRSLLKKGYTVEDMRQVIKVKCMKWRDDEEMRDFLRPSTLFAPGHFDDYLGEYATEKARLEEKR